MINLEALGISSTLLPKNILLLSIYYILSCIHIKRLFDSVVKNVTTGINKDYYIHSLWSYNDHGSEKSRLTYKVGEGRNQMIKYILKYFIQVNEIEIQQKAGEDKDSGEKNKE